MRLYSIAGMRPQRCCNKPGTAQYGEGYNITAGKPLRFWQTVNTYIHKNYHERFRAYFCS